MVTRRTTLSLTPIWCYGIVLMCHNVLQLTEVGDYKAQNLNIKRMLNRSRNVDITT